MISEILEILNVFLLAQIKKLVSLLYARLINWFN